MIRYAIFLILGTLVLGCQPQTRLRFGGQVHVQVTKIINQSCELLHQGRELKRAGDLARQALARDPDAAGAHRVLARLATLADDNRGAFDHRLRALADTRNNGVGLILNQIAISNLDRAQLGRLGRLVADLAARHPNGQARAEARSALVGLQRRTGQWPQVEATLRQLAPLRHWVGIAGFDNEDGKGFQTPYPPQTEVKLKADYAGTRGRVRWRKVTLSPREAVLELQHRFYPFSWNVGYLLTYVESPRSMKAVLEVVSEDPIQVWLNDRKVLAAQQLRGARSRQFRLPVELNAGANKLLVKTCQKSGSWPLGVRFSRTDGSPLRLRAVATPAAYRRDTRPPLAWDDRYALSAAVAALPAGKQRELWRAIYLAGAGLVPTALNMVSNYLEKNPNDPVALIYGTRLHRREGELQRATELVDRGLKLPPPYNSWFWIERAEIYAERGQEDRAFEALGRAAKTAPNGLGVAKAGDRLLGGKGWNLERCRRAEALSRKRPGWAWPTTVLANCLRRLGRVKESYRQLTRAVKLRPASPGRRDMMVRSFLDRGQCDQAVSWQRETVRIWPWRATPRLRLGDVYRRCARLKPALKAYREALARVPGWHLPHRRIGLVYFEQGKVEQAVVAWRQALRCNPEDARLWDRVTHLRPDNDPLLMRHRPDAMSLAKVVDRARAVVPAEGASIVWLLDHDVTRLMPDGTVKRVVSSVRMAADQRGRDALGEDNLPRRGLVKVLEAYTVSPTGQRREVTSMRGSKVRYPTLEKGSVVVLQYRHIEPPSGHLRNHYTTTWWFQQNLEQVDRAQWVLAVPASRKLNVYVQGKVDHATKNEDDTVVHRFSTSQVPPLKLERLSPPSSDLMRRVTVSTVPSWDYFSQWSRNLTAEVFAMNPALERVLTELTANKKTMTERINAVYHFALTRIRYQQDYETFLAGVKPHNASVVLARGYGDCKDKSVLIIALLRKLGVKAQFALIRTRGAGRVITDVPSQQFNHAVVYLPVQPGVTAKHGRFLDATAEGLDLDALRSDVQGTAALVLSDAGHRFVQVPYQRPETNLSQLKLEMTLAEDGQGELSALWTMRGRLAGKFRKSLQNKQILRQVAQFTVHQMFSDCTLKTFEVTGQQSIVKPLQIRLTAHCDGVARSEEGALRLRLPKVCSQVTGLARWTTRRHPLLFGPPALLEVGLEITLPEGIRLRARPEDITLDSPCGTLSGSWTSGPGKLSYHQRFTRTCAELSAAKYARFRSVLNQLGRYLDREVVMARGAAAKPTRAKLRRAKSRKGR